MKNTLDSLKPFIVGNFSLNEKDIENIAFYICKTQMQVEFSTVYDKILHYNVALSFEQVKKLAIKYNLQIKLYEVWNNGRLQFYNFEKGIFEF